MVKSLIPDDPHRLKAVKGPEQVLEPNQASCSLDELPGYMRSIAADTPLAVDLFSGAGCRRPEPPRSRPGAGRGSGRLHR